MTQGENESAATTRTRCDPVSVTVLSFGLRMRCLVARVLLHDFRAALPPFTRLVPGPTGGSAWQVTTSAELAAVIATMQLTIAELAEDVIFVHAGVVAVDGRAIVLPGRSGAGKSTLVAALLQRGAHYLSDEFAPITSDGLVMPYPRQLSLRAETAHMAPAVATTARTESPTAVAPIGLVAALRYEAGATSDWRNLTSAETMLSLIDNTVAARSRPQEMLSHIARGLDSGSGPLLAVSGVRGEAGAAADALLSMLHR